jgi:hypothetical protein
MLAVYYRKEGHKYLKKLVDPLLNAINSRSDSWEVKNSKNKLLNLQIDPNKAENNDADVEKNLEKLIQVTQELIDNLINATSDCPGYEISLLFLPF